jgi:hypothetical protein
MDGLFTWIIIGYAAWWFYKQGKHTGSRKGYNAGRSRQHRSSRRRR